MIWSRSLVLLGVAFGVATLLAATVSDTAAAWWLAACFAGFAAYHVHFLAELHRWAALPRNRELPLATGVWGPVFERLRRFVRQEAENRSELGGELERVHAAVDRLPDGLVVLDRFHHVQWSNIGAQQLHGIFGTRRPIHHFIRAPEFLDLLERRDAVPLRLALPTRPGRTFELTIHRTDEQQMLLLTRDVTDQARLDAMRRDFVANVSHEIRTPITVIGGFAETLLTLDIDEAARREYLGTILKQSHNMQRLVEDLLTLASLENSSGPATDDPVDVHALLRALVDEGRVLSAGQHTIGVNLEGPRRVLGSATELEIAARNLITNAIRYTPAGGRIDVSWSLHAGEGWLSVRDNGIGIAPEHLPRLTERFYRVDRGRSRAAGGTGLGLAIVRHVLQRHRGQLVVDSRPEQGSTFTLKFPPERIVRDVEGTPVDGLPSAEVASAALPAANDSALVPAAEPDAPGAIRRG